MIMFLFFSPFLLFLSPSESKFLLTTEVVSFSPVLAVGRTVLPCINSSLTVLSHYLNSEMIVQTVGEVTSAFRQDSVHQTASSRIWQDRKQLLARRAATSGGESCVGRRELAAILLCLILDWLSILGTQLCREKQL